MEKELDRTMNILVILQNAYFSDGNSRSRKEWLKGLERSYSGARLKRLLDGIDENIIFENASPEIGSTSNSCFPADQQHLKNLIRVYKPHLVIACGEIAQRGIKEINVPSSRIIETPHPSWRALTNQLLDDLNKQIKTRIAEQRLDGRA